MTNTQVWRRAVRRGTRRRIGACCALVLAAAVAVAGCSASGGDASSAQRDDAADAKQADSAPYDAATPTPSGATGSGTTRSGTAPAATPTPTTYLVRTATLSVRTPHVQDQLARARQDADRAGGYAGDETTIVDAHGRSSSTIQLRVPPSRYDAVLAELGSLGKLLERKVNVQDVTGQVVDVNSRIRSQQASVARVRALMDKATDLTDVVSLEGELSTRESALESLEAQQKSLTSRTDLATITLKLSEAPVKVAAARSTEHRGFWSTVGHAFAVGWHGFTVALRGLLVALAVALPFLAVVGLLGYLAYRLRRRVP